MSTPPGDGTVMPVGWSSGSGAVEFTLQPRTGVSTFPVPSLRPASATAALALDLIPTPGAVGVGGNGITWIDLCSNDPDTTNNFVSGRMGIWSNQFEVGSRNWGTASAIPVKVTINGTPHLFVNADGGVMVADGGGKVGFYGVAPVVSPVLATGASHTVDDVISALQTLGLVKQA